MLFHSFHGGTESGVEGQWSLGTLQRGGYHFIGLRNYTSANYTSLVSRNLRCRLPGGHRIDIPESTLITVPVTPVERSEAR